MDWSSKNQIALASGVSFAVIIALLVLPVFAGKDTIFLVNGNNATPEPCNGNTGLVLAQNLTDLCDVTIVSPMTNQLIHYNGTQWVNVNSTGISESTVCTNVGSGIVIIKDSIGGNCDVKSLVNGTAIQITNGTNTITLTNTAPESTVCTSTGIGGSDTNLCYGGNVELKSLTVDGGLSIGNSCSGQCLQIVNTLPESTVCTNDGHGSGIVCNGGNIHLKGIASGTGITVTQNGTDIIITNSAVDTDITYLDKNTVGTNFQIFKNSTTVGSTTTNYFRTIVNSTGISMTNTSDTITAKTNFANGTGISITGTGKQTFTNTGVISNSCSAPIVCSGTNPSAISFADNPYWQKLCQNSLGGTATSLSCSGFTAKKNLYVTMLIRVTTNTISPGIQYNSNSSSVYADRFSVNGAADTTQTAQASCQPIGTNTIGSGSFALLSGNIYNQASTDQKAQQGFFSVFSNTTPTKSDYSCVWNDIKNQITTITLMRSSGSGNYNTGTEITVWGYD